MPAAIYLREETFVKYAFTEMIFPNYDANTLLQTVSSLKVPLIFLERRLLIKGNIFLSPLSSLGIKNSSLSAISLILLLLSVTSVSLAEALFSLLNAVFGAGSASDDGGTWYSDKPSGLIG